MIVCIREIVACFPDRFELQRLVVRKLRPPMPHRGWSAGPQNADVTRYLTWRPPVRGWSYQWSGMRSARSAQPRGPDARRRGDDAVTQTEVFITRRDSGEMRMRRSRASERQSKVATVRRDVPIAAAVWMSRLTLRSTAKLTLQT